MAVNSISPQAPNLSLQDAVDTFLRGVRYDGVQGQSNMDGENIDKTEQPIVDHEFDRMLNAIAEAAKQEETNYQASQRRFYIVFGAIAFLILVCFIIGLTTGGQGIAAVSGKAGVFAAITGLFGLFLDHERKTMVIRSDRSAQANLLKSILGVLRDPAEKVRVVSATKKVLEKYSTKKTGGARPRVRRVT